MKLSYRLPPVMEMEGIKVVKVSKETTIEDATMDELAEEISDLEAQGYVVNVALKVSLPKEEKEKE